VVFNPTTAPVPVLVAAEYKRIALVTGAGFLALGVMGYLVKLLHLPVNNLLVGGA
jgi:protein transport protein SEC61 subunit gamma-like protein